MQVKNCGACLSCAYRILGDLLRSYREVFGL